jgi:hypothetical protein
MELLDEASVFIVAQTLQSSSDKSRIPSPLILLADQLVIPCRDVPRGVLKRCYGNDQRPLNIVEKTATKSSKLEIFEILKY